MTDEPIMRWFCACSEYADDPGSVVCWRCEQVLVDVTDRSALNGIAIHNLLGLCVRYRRALEEIVDSPTADDRQLAPEAERWRSVGHNATRTARAVLDDPLTTAFQQEQSQLQGDA